MMSAKCAQRLLSFWLPPDPTMHGATEVDVQDVWPSLESCCVWIAFGIILAHSLIKSKKRSVPGRGHNSNKRTENPECENPNGTVQKAKMTPRLCTVQRVEKGKSIRRHEDEARLNQLLGASDPTVLAQSEDMDARVGISAMSDYALVIKHSARQSNPIVAHQWLRRAIEIGHVPDHATFHHVISAYAKQNKDEPAMRIARQMKTLGVEFNTTTYNLIIGMYARVGDAVTTQTWLKQLLAAQVHATAASFGLVLETCATSGLVKDLDTVYTMSQKAGVRLNQRWFSAVVSALAKRNDLDPAVAWVKRTVDHGVRPRADCTSVLYSCVLSTGDLDLAAALMEYLRVAGIDPDGYCLSRCTAVAALIGHNKKAQEWALECAARHHALSSGARRALIHAGLPVPMSSQPGTDVSEHAQAKDATVEGQFLDAKQVDVRKTSGPMPSKTQAQLKACIGKTFTGIIKAFRQAKFGFIVCEETFKIFQRDIYLGGNDNPGLFKPGQRVSFILRIDPDVGLPRAFDLKAYQGPPPTECFEEVSVGST